MCGGRFLFICVSLITAIAASTENVDKIRKLASFEDSYTKAVEAYNADRWSECIRLFEDSVHLFKLYKQVYSNCRFQCKALDFKPIVKENIEDLKTYEKLLRTKNCLSDCYDKMFNESKLKREVKDEIIKNIEDRKPYDYLHLCYFRMNGLPQAASAAYTYLVAHPDSMRMRQNLEYYMQQPEVNIKEIDNLLEEDYSLLYNLGVKTYDETKWAETVATMEESLQEYLSWESQCRVDCEGGIGQEWASEFSYSMSHNVGTLLKCRQACQDQLKALRFNSGKEFLAELLHYLQISYYHLDNYKKAAESVASFLLLDPKDSAMLQNKEIYLEKVGSNAFVERMEILHYLKRDNYEKELLKIFNE